MIRFIRLIDRIRGRRYRHSEACYSCWNGNYSTEIVTPLLNAAFVKVLV